jgi:hypothetical protein
MCIGIGRPVLIDIPIHFSENVFPMVPPGAANIKNDRLIFAGIIKI